MTKYLFIIFKVKSKQVAIMAKRILEDLKGEHYKIDFKHDDEENQVRKKNKLENDMIINKIKDSYEDIDISQHELHKFSLIFHTLMEAVNSEENLEEGDGVITGTFALIISKLSDLLRQNIDSLKLPAIIKNALKKIKNLFNVEKTKEDAQCTTESQTSSETDGDGAKEQ